MPLFAAAALLSPLWLAIRLLQQLWPRVLGKKRGGRAKWPASSAAVCATFVPQLLKTYLFLLLLLQP